MADEYPVLSLSNRHLFPGLFMTTSQPTQSQFVSSVVVVATKMRIPFICLPIGLIAHVTCRKSHRARKSHPLFNQLYCPIGISPMGKSGCFPRRKPDATESRHPYYGACWVFDCFHTPPTSDMDYRIFNVSTDVNACDYTRGCTDTRKRVCTES